MHIEKTDELLETNKNSLLTNIVSFHQTGLRLTDIVLNDPNVQSLMTSNQTFDAVICEVFLGEALYGLSEHFKAPLIGLGTFGAISWNTDMVSCQHYHAWIRVQGLESSLKSVG